jgi:hypothetical protein
MWTEESETRRMATPPSPSNDKTEPSIPKFGSLGSWLLLVPLSFLILPCPCEPSSNDGAASVAAGGIQLRKENAISMEKERLTIGVKRVEVEYEFLNETDMDITTEVAFPIPPYQCEPFARNAPFDDFSVSVDGSEMKYQTSLRALLKGQDKTKLLTDAGISVGSIDIDIGKCYEPINGSEFSRLSSLIQEDLKQARLFDQDGNPQWAVEKIYHWNMTFPARKIVHVRHEYAPVVGQAQIWKDYFGPIKRTLQGKEEQKRDPHPKEVVEGFTQVLRNACADLPVVRDLESRHEPMVVVFWVDYVLTTANTWKTPIKNFTLVVDTTNPWDKELITTNFCWNGPVRKLDATHFIVEMKDFRPDKELSVFFLR